MIEMLTIVLGNNWLQCHHLLLAYQALSLADKSGTRRLHPRHRRDLRSVHRVHLLQVDPRKFRCYQQDSYQLPLRRSLRHRHMMHSSHHLQRSHRHRCSSLLHSHRRHNDQQH